MTAPPVNADAERPPYPAAVGVAATVLAVYVLTLAPTVTFWDAGEFLAAAKTLGIPHPPGTPLFVMIAHTWGLLVPIGEFAYRTNLLSALFSASAAGLLFLVVHQSMRGVVGGLPEVMPPDLVASTMPGPSRFQRRWAGATGLSC